MDFFSHQEKARRYTRVLIAYYLIALIFIVTAVNVVVYYFFIFLEFYPYTPQNWFTEGVVYYLSMGTLLLILSGSFYRWKKLKSGGHVVAEMVGASLIDSSTSDPQIRKFINVVEEMSIASGVPLPNIYVMENEQGINAFAAGYLPTEAVIVVTRGAIDSLNREELQGVVAHEYSHILNGDMQINIKLVAVLAGILMISLAGKMLTHGRSSTNRRSMHLSSSGRNSSVSALIILGFMLQLVGFIGVFFGRMIKAAVSRQREFLADAAAVQFTRNPQGIASALNKIVGASAGFLNNGSEIKDAHAEDMSHMCFSEALNMRFSKLLATHPPLVKRIERIYPGFLSRVKARQMTENIRETNQQAFDSSDVLQSVSMLTSVSPMTSPVTPKEVVSTVGLIDQAHIDYAQVVHESFSENLLKATYQKATAKAVVWALIVARMKKEDMAAANSCLGVEAAEAVGLYLSEIKQLKKSQQLPLFDLLLPGLKLMSKKEKVDFIEITEVLIKCDKRYSLFEFVLLSLLQQHLSSTAAENKKIKYYSFKPLSEDLQLIFSVMAQSSGVSIAERESVYQKVAKGFFIQDYKLLQMKVISVTKIQKSMQKLSLLSPLLKRNVLEACADIVMGDGKIKTAEAELLRAISESLGCPMPPLIESVD